jgi:2-oxoglutarate ferredoxin oxidoreductase subunit alpha
MHAFDLSDRYRVPAMILADAVIGQMKEALEPHPYVAPPDLKEKDWALTGPGELDVNKVVKSLYLGEGELEQHNLKLHRKYAEMQEKEVRYEGYALEDAELVVTAYGSTARIAHTAVRMAREQGYRAGLLRPITLFPFPKQAYQEHTAKGQKVLCVELNTGQMVDDVRLAVPGTEVEFYGRAPGAGSLPTPEEIFAQIRLHCEVH